MSSRALAALFGAVVLLAACGSAAAPVSPSQTGTGAPVFVPTDCWRACPAGLTMTCGYVTVPERRDRASGAIKLAVAILSDGTVTTEPATIFLAGGPGQRAIDTLAVFDQLDGYRRDGFPSGFSEPERDRFVEMSAALDIWRARIGKRPLILLDQRGTGYSEPSLACPEGDLQACQSRLFEDGVDLADYNTVENAHDVDAVRQALGYDQVDLFGGSYGTRLALEVIRRHPDHVRSAVLDGVAPPQVCLGTGMVEHYGEALDVLFDHCAADEPCAAEYPDLEATFYDLVTTLDQEPVELPVGEDGDLVPFSGQALRQITWQGMSATSGIPWLPMVIGETARGHLEPLTAALTADPVPGTGLADAMRWSVECSGHVASQHLDEVVAAADHLDPAIREGVVDDFSGWSRICGWWGVPPSDPVALTPVTSDVPVLLLSGEFDPGTPPAYAEIAAETLANATSVVLPGLGHTQGSFSTCGQTLMSEFYESSGATLKTACVAEMPGPTFQLPGK